MFYKEGGSYQKKAMENLQRIMLKIIINILKSKIVIVIFRSYFVLFPFGISNERILFLNLV